MSASTARHETRALLRAHLAAAYGYGHLTRHCPVCHRLLRLAMEPGEGGESDRETRKSGAAPEPAYEPQKPRTRSGGPTTAESAAVPPERYENGREDANEARAEDADGAERPSTA